MNRVLASLVLCLVALAPAQAQERTLTQLFHQAWGVRQGAPGSIVDLAQTTDGYLWLATSAGLYRFDGVRFERCVPLGGQLPQRIFKLQADDRAGLWVASSLGGIAYLSKGLVTTHTPLPVAMLDFAVAQDGTAWAATRDGLLRLEHSRWTLTPATALPAGWVDRLLPSRTGALWVLGEHGLFRRDRAGSGFEAVPTGLLISEDARFGISEDADGAIWLSSSKAQTTRRVATADGRPTEGLSIPLGARRTYFDRNGHIWLPTEVGLARLAVDPAAKVEWFRTSDGLSSDNTFAVLHDREGNVWVGTGAGLDFFRETALVGAPLRQRLHASRLAADETGGLWIGSQNQPLLRVRAGAVTEYRIPTPILSVARSPTGPTWAWADERLWRIDDSVPAVSFAAPATLTLPRAWSMAADSRGHVWVAFQRYGVFRFKDGEWLPPHDRRMSVESRVIYVDAKDRVWIGTGDQVLLLENGQLQSFSGQQLGVGRISAITSSRRGTWVAGDRGACLIDAQVSHPLAGVDGEAVGRISGIVEDEDGNLWLNADRGVVRIAQREVAKALGGSDAPPVFRVFDYLDGVIGGAALVPSQSAARTSDGRLWFVGFDSLVSIDPEADYANPLPPPVHIESFSSGATAFVLEPGMTLPAGTSHLEIRYTALSLTMPERVRFRYRLRGADDEWQDAGARREAFFTNLAPGKYEFQVIASNNDGVWNETGATQAFVIAPRLYQTVSFKAMLILGVIGAGWLLYRGHIRRVRSQLQERIEERMDERERIARELHDTLLQGFQGLVLRFQAVNTRIPTTDPAHTLMEEALTRADEVLVEGRDRVRGLRGIGADPEDLAAALSRLGDELARDTDALFSFAVDGDARPLHPVVRDEVYWIAREGLINAFRHGRGQRVRAELAFASRQLRIRLEDDGMGVDEAVLKSGAREHHWGLPGMRERAARIGASLELWSRQGAGTAVELRVPAHLAYQSDHPSTPRRWWRRTVKARLDAAE